MSATTGQQKTRSIGEIIDNSALGAALRVFNEYGYNSPQFKEAEIKYKIECAVNEAECQARKSENRARLYEQGY